MSRSAVFVLLAVLPSFLIAQDGDRQRLQEAGKLLDQMHEAKVREGAMICRDVDSPAAVELLLEVLNETTRRSSRHLPPAHYRDVVWEALIGIRDPYARQRVEQELRRNRGNGDVRQWCAELLGIYGDGRFAGTLTAALKDRHPGVRRWAARSLGEIGVVGAVDELSRLVRSRDPHVRANALEALAKLAPEEWAGELGEAAGGDRDGGVRCALLGAAAELLPDRVEALSREALDDDDWRPRLQAVDNLGGIRTRTAVDTLLVALDDGRPVVADRAQQALQRLTGEPIRQKEVWRKWWRDHREDFEFPDGEGKVAGDDPRRTVSYNDIPLTSDHVAFLMDRSYRMGEAMSSRDQTKEEAALEELERVLARLEGKLVFNVHTYNEEVHTFAREPVRLRGRAARAAVKFVADQDVGRAKDIWQVLETVLADPTLDTAYLLSSGEPDIGRYVHWNRVTRHLADLNRFHKVTVHTIAYSENEWYREQLEKIAEVTGGQFRWFR